MLRIASLMHKLRSPLVLRKIRQTFKYALYSPVYGLALKV
jgi:hypothetical protein